MGHPSGSAGLSPVKGRGSSPGHSLLPTHPSVNNMEREELTPLQAFKLISKRCVELFVEFLLFLFAVLRSIFVSWALWLMPKHYKDISDDIILITGGGKGIGRILALEFASHKPKRVCILGPHFLTQIVITAWISNHIPRRMWSEITYPFSSFNEA